jgi:hypothetical protein
MATREFAQKVPSIDGGVSGVVQTVRSAIATDGDEASETVCCQNCGSRDRPAAIPERPVVEDTRRFDETPDIRLCDDCEGARHGTTASIITCNTESYPVDDGDVCRDENQRCRGCGISSHRLTLGGQELELHPVVPVDGVGHRHERNLVPLCPYCHRRAHGKGRSDR